MQIKTKPGRRPTRSVVLHCRYHCYYNKQHKNLQHFLSNFVTSGRKKKAGSRRCIRLSRRRASAIRRVCISLKKTWNLSQIIKKSALLSAHSGFIISAWQGINQENLKRLLPKGSACPVRTAMRCPVRMSIGGKQTSMHRMLRTCEVKKKSTKHTGNTALFLS